MKRLVGGQKDAKYPNLSPEKESKILGLVNKINTLIKRIETLQKQLSNLEKGQNGVNVKLKQQGLKYYRLLLERLLNNPRYQHSISSLERIEQKIREIEREIQQLSAKPDTGRQKVATKMPLLRLLLIICLAAQMQAGCSKPFSTEQNSPQTVNLQEPGNPQKSDLDPIRPSEQHFAQEPAQLDETNLNAYFVMEIQKRYQLVQDSGLLSGYNNNPSFVKAVAEFDNVWQTELKSLAKSENIMIFNQKEDQQSPLETRTEKLDDLEKLANKLLVPYVKLIILDLYNTTVAETDPQGRLLLLVDSRMEEQIRNQFIENLMGLINNPNISFSDLENILNIVKTRAEELAYQIELSLKLAQPYAQIAEEIKNTNPGIPLPPREQLGPPNSQLNLEPTILTVIQDLSIQTKEELLTLLYRFLDNENHNLLDYPLARDFFGTPLGILEGEQGLQIPLNGRYKEVWSCNIYATDFVQRLIQALGRPELLISHRVDEVGKPVLSGGRELSAKDTKNWLKTHGPKYGWEKLDLAQDTNPKEVYKSTIKKLENGIIYAANDYHNLILVAVTRPNGEKAIAITQATSNITLYFIDDKYLQEIFKKFELFYLDLTNLP